MSGTIYILQVDGNGPIKIGFTTQNVYQRITSIQHGSPYVLNWICAYGGTINCERAAHHELAEFNVRGEWFHPVRPVLRFIERKCGPNFCLTEYLNRHHGFSQREEIKARLALMNSSFSDLQEHGAPYIRDWFLYLSPVSAETIARTFAALEKLEARGRKKRKFPQPLPARQPAGATP